MKKSKLVCVSLGCLLVLLASACAPIQMNMEEFGKLPSFKGRVAKVEVIPFNHVPSSASGPDCRVTVARADGSIIVITRIETYIGSSLRLQKLVEKKECDLPDEIVQCEDKHGQQTK